MMIDLVCDETQLGYSNGTSVFYRHFIIDSNATLNITVGAIIGDPTVLIMMANGPVYPTTSDPTTYAI